MTTNLPAIPSKLKALWRIVKAAGPLLIAQSEKLSEGYAKHQLRLAEVEAVKTLMVEEARTIAEIRRTLIQRYLDAPPEERIRLRQDIQQAEKELRQLGVYQKAVDYVPEGKQETIDNLDPPPQFVAWLDAFNDYARKVNEPWRTDLLARALAHESSAPGSIGQRALWFVGTVEEQAFHAFASVLDLCSEIGGGKMIPAYSSIMEEVISDCVLGPQVKLGK